MPDDEWLPRHAELLIRMFETADVVFAAGDADRFGSQVGPVAHGLMTRQGLELPDLFILENPDHSVSRHGKAQRVR
ncbi:MAG: hypothetical protein U5K74_08915 [Gemmatimonadaceae bacterium]|nr:hypothetical protein [Gemmatimonadaceae bacterium]